MPTESKKTIRTFSIASFLNDFGSDMIYPIWPIFLTSVMGMNMMMLGFLDGLGDAMVSISQAISGYLSDKYQKRKIFIWTGYLFGAISRIGYALATGWQSIIFFRVLDRAGKIRSAPRDAIVADISTETNRGKNFGILRSMDNLGAVCGILTCFFLLDLGYTTLFFIAALPSLCGVILIITAIKEPPYSGTHVFKGFSFKHVDKNFIVFLTMSAMFALGSFSYSFLLLYSKEFGFGVTALPLLYLIYTVVAAIFSMPFGKLSDTIGRKLVLGISMAFWCFTCALLLFLHHAIGIICAFIFFGLHKAALEPAQKSFVAGLAPRELRASVLGGFQMIIGLCAFPSSFLAGTLWQYGGIFSPLYCSLGLTLTALVILIFVREREKI